MEFTQKIRSSIAALIILLVLSLSLIGCGADTEEEIITFYEGPIAGWEDIAIPENAEWDHSLVSGPVENHYFTVLNMEPTELFTFVEMAMMVNGWIPNEYGSETRQFIKDGDFATFNSNGVRENILTFVVIIEPEGTYGDPEE